jgi:hypothetical protein
MPYNPKPELTQTDEIIQYYAENGGGLFRIFLGDSSKNKIRFCGNNEENLINALAIIEENPANTNVYTITLYETGAKKELIRCEIAFCYNYGKISGVNDNSKIEYYLKKLTDNQNQDDGDDEPEQLNYWERVLPPEQLGNVIQQIAGILVAKFLPDSQQQVIQGTAIAGVEPAEPIQILQNLMNKGVTIEHLRKLDGMNIVQLKTLLTML